MAVGINTSGTYTMTRADSADSATGWSVLKIEGSGGAPSLLASVGTIDLVAEGTDARAARTNKQRVMIRYNHSAGYDFTSGSTGTGATAVPSGIATIWALFLAAGSLFTKANGGMQIALSDGTNTSYWNVAGSDTYSGGFAKWAALTTTTPNETSGTAADLGDITYVGFVTDVGGTTTRFDNFVVDAIDIGDGLEFNGTTASDALFAEALVQDEVTAIGVLSDKNGKIFSQGNLDFSGTALTSISESLTFTDTIGGAYTYQFDVTGTVTLTNTSVDSDGAVDYNFDTSGATAFTMTGGGLKGFNTLTTAASQTMSGIVFQSGGTSSVANTIDVSTFNQCGAISFTGAGKLTGCTVNKPTSPVVASDLNKVDDCTFVSDGTGYAVDLGTVNVSAGDVTFTWKGSHSGYGANQTTNAVITANVTNGGTNKLVISVADGYSTPTVNNTGSGGAADVSIVAGQKTFTQTISPIPSPNYEYRLYTVTAEGSMTGATEITAEGEENATTGSHAYTHSESNQPVAVQIISDDYKEKISYYTLTAANLSVTINLETDFND